MRAGAVSRSLTHGTPPRARIVTIPILTLRTDRHPSIAQVHLHTLTETRSESRYAPRSSTSRSNVSTGADNGIANRLRINGKSLGDLRQRCPHLVKGNRATTTIVVQARRPETTTGTRNERRDCSTMRAILRGDSLHRHPRFVIGHQLRTLLGSQSCLRLGRIFRDRTPCIAPSRVPAARIAPLGALENTANQRFQRRTLV